MNLVDELLKVAANAALVVENVDDTTAEWRMGICLRCDKLDKMDMRCKVCKCYLEIKTTTKTNRNPKKLRYEVTHCPLGKWDDLETANKYRIMDGLPPL